MSATATTIQQWELGIAKLWLVLVGVNHYQDRQIRNLRYGVNDAQELAEALQAATQRFQQLEITALYDGSDQVPTLGAGLFQSRVNKSKIVKSRKDS